MTDPRIAHLVDARILLSALPRASQSDLFEIRREFARFLTVRRSRAQYPTWQDAWNDWTGAAPGRAGHIRYMTPRCPACHGKRFSTRNISRNLARTGRPDICGECQGTGRGKQVTQVATFIAPPPEPATESTEPGEVTT